MHEYSLMDSVLEHVTEKLGDSITAPIRTLRMRIGALEIHSRPSFEQAFEARSKGTVLEGAKLELEIVPAKIVCGSCGHQSPIGAGEADVHDPEPMVECPKCGKACPVEGGYGVGPIEVDVDD